MQTPSSQLQLFEFHQRNRGGGIRNSEDIIHSIITCDVTIAIIIHIID